MSANRFILAATIAVKLYNPAQFEGLIARAVVARAALARTDFKPRDRTLLLIENLSVDESNISRGILGLALGAARVSPEEIPELAGPEFIAAIRRGLLDKHLQDEIVAATRESIDSVRAAGLEKADRERLREAAKELSTAFLLNQYVADSSARGRVTRELGLLSARLEQSRVGPAAEKMIATIADRNFQSTEAREQGFQTPSQIRRDYRRIAEVRAAVARKEETKPTAARIHVVLLPSNVERTPIFPSVSVDAGAADFFPVNRAAVKDRGENLVLPQTEEVQNPPNKWWSPQNFPSYFQKFRDNDFWLSRPFLTVAGASFVSATMAAAGWFFIDPATLLSYAIIGFLGGGALVWTFLDGLEED